MQETYTFRILSNEEENFILEIKLPSNKSFLDFHKAIIEGLGYDKSLLTSFYLTNAEWEKQQEITLIDMSEESNSSLLRMEDCLLKDFIAGERSRLLFVFDFFFERAFNIEVIQNTQKDIQEVLPLILKLEGTIPQQAQIPNIEEESLEDLMDNTFDEDISFESLDDFEL